MTDAQVLTMLSKIIKVAHGDLWHELFTVPNVDEMLLIVPEPITTLLYPDEGDEEAGVRADTLAKMVNIARDAMDWCLP